MGILDSFRIRCTDLDAIVVDLDVGAVHVPPSIVIPCLPQPYQQRLIHSLQMVFNFSHFSLHKIKSFLLKNILSIIK